MPKKFIYFHNASRGDGTYRRFPLTRFLLIFGTMLIVGIAGAIYFWRDINVMSHKQEALSNYAEVNDSIRTILEELKRNNDSVKQMISTIEKTESSLNELVPPVKLEQKQASKIPYSLSMSLYQSYTDTLRVYLRSVAEQSSKPKQIWDKLPIAAPVTGEHVVVSRKYGVMADPFTGVKKLHPGINFSAPKGSPVKVTADGVVKKAYRDKYWGNRIEVSHGNGLVTVYTHLDSIKVPVGRRIEKGSIIGTVGETGWSIGPEVHYQIRRNGKSLDPQTILLMAQK